MASEDDQFLDHLTLECAKALAKWFKEALNVQRPIISLTKTEMLGAATAVTSEWIKVVSKRKAEGRLDCAKAVEYDALLMGG